MFKEGLEVLFTKILILMFRLRSTLMMFKTLLPTNNWSHKSLN